MSNKDRNGTRSQVICEVKENKIMAGSRYGTSSVKSRSNLSNTQNSYVRSLLHNCVKSLRVAGKTSLYLGGWLAALGLCAVSSFAQVRPSIPQSLAAPQVTNHSATLTWQPVTACGTDSRGVALTCTGYSVLRSTIPGQEIALGFPSQPNPTVITTTTFTDTSVVAGQTYYYVVTTMNSGSISSVFSNEVQAVIPGDTSFTPVRIKPGPTYTDSQGNLWSADTTYCSGGSTFTTTHAITGALPSLADGALYQTERYDNPGATTCTIPAPAGTYSLTVKFAELYFAAAGQRLFNVTINGVHVLSNFDIFAAAGGQYNAIDKTITVTSTGAIIVSFVKGTANNAKYDAIQLVQSAGPPPMSTACAWLADGVTWRCDTTTVNMPTGTPITTVVTSGTLSNTSTGTHP